MPVCSRCGKVQKIGFGGLNISFGDTSRFKAVMGSLKRTNQGYIKDVGSVLDKTSKAVRSVKPTKNSRLAVSLREEQRKWVLIAESQFSRFLNSYINDVRTLFQELKESVAEL